MWLNFLIAGIVFNCIGVLLKSGLPKDLGIRLQTGLTTKLEEVYLIFIMLSFFGGLISMITGIILMFFR